MDLNEFLGPKPVVVELRAENRWEAIDELLDHLAATQKIEASDRDAIGVAVKKRESAMSTGIGFGIGLPHATTDLVQRAVVAIGRSRKGIQFDAIDGKPVHLVLILLVPTGQFQKHVDLLANIAKLFHRKDFRDGFWNRFM